MGAEAEQGKGPRLGECNIQNQSVLPGSAHQEIKWEGNKGTWYASAEALGG